MKRTPELKPEKNQENPKIAGLNMDQLNRLSAAIHQDVEADLYDGASFIVARHGVIGLHEAVGFANRAAKRPLPQK